MSEHPDAAELAAYVDGRLEQGRRPLLEAHLADCAACQDDVAAALRTSRPSRSPISVAGVPRRWLYAGSLATAAGIAGILLLSGDRRQGHAGPSHALRDRTASGALAVVALAPGPNDTVQPTGVAFVWHAVAAATYRLTLSDAHGDVAWTATATDTALTLPETMRLRSGASYFWYVDALLPDGRTATSGAQRVEVAR